MLQTIRNLAVLGFCSLAAFALVAAAHDQQDAKAKDKVQPKKGVFTDPKEGGVDYVVMGEYVGQMQGGQALGCQVIALGDGAFQAVVLPGGLTGEGWDGTNKILMDGDLDKDKVNFVPTTGKRSYLAGSSKVFCATAKFPPVGQKDYKAVILVAAGTNFGEGQVMKGTTEDGKSFELKKIMRKSKTLGAKPPEGAVVLFDGKNADEWKEGKIKDGVLPVEANSKRTFKDFKLHLEFVSPFQPNARGQARGNSGVYLHGKHEIQVLDSFGLAGLNNECGGFYSKRDPLVNMCYPPLSWQTYDVEIKSDPVDPNAKTQMAKCTVYHNGVKIHDNFPLPSGQGHFHLQNHGDPVFYRNIWVLELK